MRVDLDRFVQAQEGVYEGVVAELGRGRKASHWMWFLFPQIEGLGRSEMSRRYAIRSIEEARAYAAHPVLGPRIRECVGLLLAVEDRSATEIFGPVDATKLRSSMTLFDHAVPEEPVFRAVLERYFSGEPDPLTIARL